MTLTRTAVVVAAGPGLGAAIGRRFSREGFRVALVARSADGVDLTGLDGGGPPVVVTGDVADPESLGTALGRVREEAGDPEVAIYNASLYVPGAPTELTYDDLLRGFRVGVAGALVTAHELVPAMREAGRGTLVLTGSEAGLHPNSGSAALTIEKFALRALALGLAQELRPYGVHAATVTIRGVLAAGTPFDPDVVADAYWALHAEGERPPDQWHPEVWVTRSGVVEPSAVPPRD